jgi:hypothetical protein
MTRGLCVEQDIAREVAAAYLNAPTRRDSLCVAAFAQLVNESDELFRSIAGALQVVFTMCATPYRDAHELIASVRHMRTLEVPTVAVDPERRHPLMGNDFGGSYDRFRAVHDVLGHARLQLGFDRDGEYAVWRSQERFHSPLARRALATELHGQHSVRWTTGEVAAPKAMLLEASLVRRARLRDDR